MLRLGFHIAKITKATANQPYEEISYSSAPLKWFINKNVPLNPAIIAPTIIAIYL